MMHGRMTLCFRVERINRGQTDPHEPKPRTVAGPMTGYGQENAAPLRDHRMIDVDPMKPGI